MALPNISRRKFARYLGVLTATGMLGALTACSGDSSGAGAAAQGTQEDWLKQDPATATLFLFDTVVNLKAYCPQELMDKAAERCSYFEQKFSRTVEGSDVYNINNAGGAPVEVCEETADLISKSLAFCEKSGGLFDITIGAVSSLWDFVEGVKPADADVKEAVKHIDYRGVSVEGTTVALADPAAMLDLGGTAKGYIADDLKRLFNEGGCTCGIIDLGGNVLVLGSKPDGSEWNIGVRDPNGTENDVIASVKGADVSVVTSGLYEREFTVGGKTYYHILDPKTGYPAKTDLASSSVIGTSSLECDAYATWLFLLGHDAALELLEETDGLEGLVVDPKDKVSQTSAQRFELR